MPKPLIATALFVLALTSAFGQASDSTRQWHKPYAINKPVDIPLTAALAGFTIYNFAEIGRKGGTSEAKVMSLTRNDVNWFDRWAIRPYNKGVDKASYLPFYAAIPYPVIFLGLDKTMRKDYLELSFLYLQAMCVTGALYTTAVHYFSRLRPLVYDPGSPMDTRTTSNSRNAFFAGHVALVATSTFFMAQVFADYHPGSKLKWVMYGAAGVATGATAYMRLKAGEHFPSDIIVGTAIGALTGLLVPKLHRTKLIRDQKISLIPYAGPSSGLALVYKL
ncbi:MAG TPA: phosphatase PAP2 family protein [Puia sp.]|jgi:membrane-associated phospholipid phosphatase